MNRCVIEHDDERSIGGLNQKAAQWKIHPAPWSKNIAKCFSSQNGKRYLVAPREYTQWVRNAIASGTISLKKGRRSEEFAVRMLSEDKKPEILKSYLDRYKLTVRRYFPVRAGSPIEAFDPWPDSTQSSN